jgi:tRNA(Glu) U13 pseudouridine synthase TruD
MTLRSSMESRKEKAMNQVCSISHVLLLQALLFISDLIDDASRHKKSRKPYVPPRIKTLTESDLDKYTIFDVIMPLPGTDVAYPGGKLGERYKEFLRMDGLDPDNFVRKQRSGPSCVAAEARD